MIAPSMALVREIASEEATTARINPALIFARDRRACVVWARARVCKRLRETGRYSLLGIAARLGIDHTSVLHAIRRELPESPPFLPRVGMRGPRRKAIVCAREVFRDTDRADIIRLYQSGRTISQLRRAYRCGRGAINVVLSDAKIPRQGVV